MPIFGQVWLWSLLAFLLGALLCWVLVVLPVRKRIDALERRLATIRTETKHSAPSARSAPDERPQPSFALLPERPAGSPPHQSTPSIVPGFGDPDGRDDEIPVDTLTRAYAMPSLDVPAAPPADEAAERGALSLSAEPEGGPTQYLGT